MKINGEEWKCNYRCQSHSVFFHADGRHLTHWRNQKKPLWTCRKVDRSSRAYRTDRGEGETAEAAIEELNSALRRRLTRALQTHLNKASALRTELAKMGGGRG